MVFREFCAVGLGNFVVGNIRCCRVVLVLKLMGINLSKRCYE